MDPDVIGNSAGAHGQFELAEIRERLAAEIPESRRQLLPAVAAHAALLATQLDRIDKRHQAAGKQLADWITESYEPGRALSLIFVCTGNSRRSMLGSILGNVAAAYYGLPEIRCYSGGTQPSSFNPRTVATLRAIGIEIEETHKGAERGKEGLVNPIYHVRWGTAGAEPPLEIAEFSKRYDDPWNPADRFAALMVCSEADASCPAVKGTSTRISMPYLDPKQYDGTEDEVRQYAERRDDIGRMLLGVMLQARWQLSQTGRRPAS